MKEELSEDEKDVLRRETVSEIRSKRVLDTFELEDHQCYNGNHNLKKAGVNLPYTPEQIEEFIKCKNDVLYFIENYCEIVTLDYGLQPFVTYPYQKEMIKKFDNSRRTIALCGRQLGKALGEGTKILTTTGFKNIENVVIGDYVFGYDGKTTMVIDKTDRIISNDCYKITFDDYSEFIADGEHDWILNIKGDKKIFNTKELFKKHLLKEELSIDINQPTIFNNLNTITIDDIRAYNVEKIINSTVSDRTDVLNKIILIPNISVQAKTYVIQDVALDFLKGMKLLLSTLGVKSTIEGDTIIFNYRHDLGQNNKDFYFIKNLSRIHSTSVYCLTVDNLSHTFLIGESLISTHNCITEKSLITIKNKKTDVIETLSIGDFFNSQN